MAKPKPPSEVPDEPDDDDAPDDDAPDDELGEADLIIQAEVDEDMARREWENIGTERLKAYAEVAAVYGDIIHPVASEAPDCHRRRLRRLCPRVRGALELALIAMAEDTQRLARFSGAVTGERSTPEETSADGDPSS